MSTNQSFFDNRNNNKVVVTKLQGGFPINAPLATQPQTTMSVQQGAGYGKPLSDFTPEQIKSATNNGWDYEYTNATNATNATNSQPLTLTRSPRLSKDRNFNGFEDEDEDEDEYNDDENEYDDEDEDVDEYDDDENEYDDEDENIDNNIEGGASVADTTSTVSTTELFGRDPLYLVLSSFLSNDDGENIVDVLGKINRNLAKLVAVLDKDKKDNKSIKKNKGDEKRKSKS
jgi:hypothetical protein